MNALCKACGRPEHFAQGCRVGPRPPEDPNAPAVERRTPMCDRGPDPCYANAVMRVCAREKPHDGACDGSVTDDCHPVVVSVPALAVDEAADTRIDELRAAQPAEVTRSITAGIKYDGGKDAWHLVPWSAVREVVHVLMVGAKKYAPDNWQRVEPWRERYFDAALRHLTAWYDGERADPETGKNHLAHAGCCVLFLLWRDREPTKP